MSSFIVRASISCKTACSASSVGAGSSANSGAPSAPYRYTPSSTRQGRCMLRLAADPKHWISVTAQLSASSALRPLRPACRSWWRVVVRWTTCSTCLTSSGCTASNTRNGMGSDSTPVAHWHVGDGVVHPVRGGLCHALGAARRAEPARLAAERDEPVLAAVATAQSQEAVRQDAAFEHGGISTPCSPPVPSPARNLAPRSCPTLHSWLLPNCGAAAAGWAAAARCHVGTRLTNPATVR